MACFLERPLTCCTCPVPFSDTGEGGAEERSAANAARSAAGRCDDFDAKLALMEAKEAEYEKRKQQKGPASALQMLMVGLVPCACRHRAACTAFFCAY